MTQKRDREQNSIGEGKTTVMCSGREVWRKKKIPRKRERKEGAASCTRG